MIVVAGLKGCETQEGGGDYVSDSERAEVRVSRRGESQNERAAAAIPKHLDHSCPLHSLDGQSLTMPKQPA